MSLAMGFLQTDGLRLALRWMRALRFCLDFDVENSRERCSECGVYALTKCESGRAVDPSEALEGDLDKSSLLPGHMLGWSRLFLRVPPFM
jgi:hypothetical protein